MKNILAIVGSGSSNSANHKLVETIKSWTSEEFKVTIYTGLKTLPHFDPELSTGNPPGPIIAWRKSIEQADGVIICTPEYIYSIPSGLKNALEWCIATTLFSFKPVGLITASANGIIGQEQLQLIMNTVGAKFTEGTCLLIQGIKGKFDERGILTDKETQKKLERFIKAYINLVNDKSDDDLI